MRTYLLYDGLGSTTDLTDANGNAVAGYSYDVFGAIRAQSGSSGNYWLFTGEQRDSDSSFYYLRARYYDPASGRFLGLDLVPAVNPYLYVGDNPVNYVDPSGLCHERLGWDQMCGHWAHNKESDNFGGGSEGLPEYIVYAGTVCLIAVPADGPAPVGDAGCVVIGGAIIIGGVCIAYCDDAINAIGNAARTACSFLTLCSKSDGGRYAGDPRTAGEIIAQEKKGIINRVWPEQWRGKTYDEIKRAADAGDAAAKKAKKLLDQREYDKGR